MQLHALLDHMSGFGSDRSKQTSADLAENRNFTVGDLCTTRDCDASNSIFHDMLHEKVTVRPHVKVLCKSNR